MDIKARSERRRQRLLASSEVRIAKILGQPTADSKAAELTSPSICGPKPSTATTLQTNHDQSNQENCQPKVVDHILDHLHKDRAANEPLLHPVLGQGTQVREDMKMSTMPSLILSSITPLIAISSSF